MLNAISSENLKDSVSIGCFSAFWGDSPHALSQFTSNPSHCPNYLVGDYLSEVTMAILAKIQKATKIGYVPEIVQIFSRDLWGKWPNNLKGVIVNAGGLDPIGLKKALDVQQEKLIGIKGDSNDPINPSSERKLPWKIAAVFGDDMRDNLQMDKWNSFSLVGEDSPSHNNLRNTQWLSVNAYFGANGIVEALNNGANIVITGRCVDSALVLAPLIKEFQWKWNDYDALANGSLAGHIIECGCQCTGGNFTDWMQSLNGHPSGWINVGFPIVEFKRDLTCIITKLPETGGIVNTTSVSEQILYEIQDPSNYILPDVIVDFTQIQVEDIGKDRVKVWGAKGKAPTSSLKICATYSSKYKMEAMIMIGGLDATSKAQAVGKAIIDRSNMLLQKFYKMEKFSDSWIEVLGSEDTYGPHTKIASITREVILRIVVVHSNPKALQVFAKEIAPSATSMAPGISGAGGRPKEQPLIEYAAFLIDKSDAPQEKILIHDEKGELKTIIVKEPSVISTPVENIIPLISSKSPTHEIYNEISTNNQKSNQSYNETTIKVPLYLLCHARSGDKGPICNIGIRCRFPELYPILSKQLNVEKLNQAFYHLKPSNIKKYDLPGLHSWNFLIDTILGGGGLSSLRIDRQGKAIAQQCLTIINVEILQSLLNQLISQNQLSDNILKFDNIQLSKL